MRGMAGPAPRAATAGVADAALVDRTLTRGGAGARGAAGASPDPPGSVPVGGAYSFEPSHRK